MRESKEADESVSTYCQALKSIAATCGQISVLDALPAAIAVSCSTRCRILAIRKLLPLPGTPRDRSRAAGSGSAM